MWLLVGLMLGAFVGAIGNGGGALIGAIVGGIAGWMFSEHAKTANERYNHLEAIIRQLADRVALLEEQNTRRSAAAPVGESSEAQAPTPPIVPDAVAPASDAGVVPDEPAPSAADQPSQSPQPPEPEPYATPTPLFPRESPATPTQPSAVWKFLFGGNTLVRFGVIVLFFGVAFLLKYASERIEISIEARLIGVALAAIAMLGIGWRLRQSRPGYGLVVQGGGIGLLYLTVFAAFRLYQVLPGGLVFVLLAAMAVLSAMLAVLQDSPSLAAMGVTGGFLAPLLASTGGGSHVALFSFYALLNFGILIIAWFKAWRSLNLLGFAFTFVIGLIWGGRDYRPELFASTEPFLILFFLFYVAIAVLFALRQEATIKSRVDGTLVFGTPLIAFGLQTALMWDFEYGAAYSALALSFFYLILAKTLFARAGDNVRLLVEAFIALGVVFGTLAVPLALDGRWTAAAWALEGAAIVWIGVRQEKIAARFFGIILQFAAGAAFLLDVQRPHALVVFNSFYLGCVFIAVAGLFSAWYLRRARGQVSELELSLAIALFCWGNVWWFGGGFEEITHYVRAEPAGRRFYYVHAALLLITSSCALSSVLRRRLDWREALYTAIALLPLMYGLTAGEIARAAHPLEYFGYVAWPLAFATHLWVLYRHDDEIKYADWWHAAGLWLLAVIGGWELAWWIGEWVSGGEAWRLVGWSLVPLALLAWLAGGGARIAWPVAAHRRAYLGEGALPLALFLWLWMLHANFTSRGDAAPLPYLPLLNPLDLTQFATLMALFAWWRTMRTIPSVAPLLQSAEVAYVGLGSAAFFWLNGMLLRSLHHWAGVPFEFEALMRSMIVQASLSIFWSLLALCTMLCATRLRQRPLWLTGAGLMAVVVVKLFFVDLSNVGGIERIVSFIAVGVLMLVIGYVSPVPPSGAEEAK